MKNIVRSASLLFLGMILLVSCSRLSSCGSSPVTGEKWSPDSGRAPKAGDWYENPTDGYVLVWIPGGEFQMGSDDDDQDSRPVTKITVEGFWLGKYEVTNEQYSRFLEQADPWHQTPYLNEEGYNNPKQPVTAIRFYDALGYCQWSGLRMPNEAEWEYAAKGGDNNDYGTRNGSINHDLANYMGTGGTDIWLDSTAPVGSFPANPFGLFDMAGNVWEWTSSLYQAYPYTPDDGREDLNARDFRVMRGGSWQFSEVYCKTTNRHYFDMHLRYDFVGMRLAKTFLSR